MGQKIQASLLLQGPGGVSAVDAATVAARLGAAFGATPTPDQLNGMPALRFEREGVVLLLQAFFGGWSLTVRRPGAAEKTLFSETVGDLIRELRTLGLVQA